MNDRRAQSNALFRPGALLSFALLIATTLGSLAAQGVQTASSAPPAQETSVVPAATACPFCRKPLGIDDFCAHCGRLAKLTAISAEHRFWGDAVYADFARLGDVPKLDAELSSDGLVSEIVSFGSGDRFEMSNGKKGVVIKGKVGGSATRKEDSYKADLTETFDDQGRLVQRQLWAKRNGDPDTYIYRLIDYRRSPDGLLDKIAFSTKVYLGSADWEKRPAAWIRHSGGEIAMLRDAGTLRGIETKVRVFKRSLRGEPEPGEERTFKETVVRSGGVVDAVVAAEPAGQ